jgi:hypothetical protein
MEGFKPDCRSRVEKIRVSCSGGHNLRAHLRTGCCKVVVEFFSPFRRIPEQYLKLDHDHLLPTSVILKEGWTDPNRGSEILRWDNLFPPPRIEHRFLGCQFRSLVATACDQPSTALICKFKKSNPRTLWRNIGECRYSSTNSFRHWTEEWVASYLCNFTAIKGRRYPWIRS